MICADFGLDLSGAVSTDTLLDSGVMKMEREYYDEGYASDAAIDEITLIAEESNIDLSEAYDIWFNRYGYRYPAGVLDDIYSELGF